MDSKQLVGKLNVEFSVLEWTNLLRAAHHEKSVEQLKRSLNDVQEICLKESLENAASIQSLLGHSLNPYAYLIGDLLINQLKELELLNRSTALSFNRRHLDVLDDQKVKLGQLIDQSLGADNLFKCESKNAKISEDRQAMWAQFGTAVVGQLEEIFGANNEPPPVDREQIDLKIKREYLASLLPIIEQFVKQRLEFIDQRECDSLKELFSRTMRAFEEEFKRAFRGYKISGQLQRDQFDALLHRNRETVDQQPFKESFEGLKAKMLLKLEELERSYNEEARNQLSSLAKDLSDKITFTLQRTCDQILEKSRQLIEGNQSNYPTRSTYQSILTELFSFNQLLESVPASKSNSIKRERAEKFKAKTREVFSKICAHRFKSNELAKLRTRSKSTKRTKS